MFLRSDETTKRKRKVMKYDLQTTSDEELQALIMAARQELRSRMEPGKFVKVCLDLTCDDKKVRPWAKTAEGLDLTQRGAYAVTGVFEPQQLAIQSGKLLLLGASTGSDKSAARFYVLIEAEEGQRFETKNGKFHFTGTGAKLVATSKDEVDVNAVLREHPDLARAATDETFAIVFALRELGF